MLILNKMKEILITYDRSFKDGVLHPKAILNKYDKNILAFIFILIQLFFIINKGLPAYYAPLVQLSTSGDSASQRQAFYQIANGDNSNPILPAMQYMNDIKIDNPSYWEQMSKLPIQNYMISLYFNVTESVLAYIFPFWSNFNFLILTEILAFAIPSIMMFGIAYRFDAKHVLIAIIMSTWLWLSKAGEYLLGGYYNHGHIGSILAFCAVLSLYYKRYNISISLAILALLARSYLVIIPALIIVFLIFDKKYAKSILAIIVLMSILKIKSMHSDLEYAFRYDWLLEEMYKSVAGGVKSTLVFAKGLMARFIEPGKSIPILMITLYSSIFIIVAYFKRNKFIVFVIIGILWLWFIGTLAPGGHQPHHDIQFEIIFAGVFFIILIDYVKEVKTPKELLIALVVLMSVIPFRYITENGTNNLNHAAKLQNNVIIFAQQVQAFQTEVLDEYSKIPKYSKIQATSGASIHLNQEYRIMHRYAENEIKNTYYDMILLDITSAIRMKEDILTGSKNFQFSEVYKNDLMDLYPYMFKGKYIVMFSKNKTENINLSTKSFFDE